ncbi:MAG: 16S rRNA (cytosine(1402)-N(4))-methyltransferase RsmH [Bacteroidales bacterium]|jgi:16S rRNA (cytosine1402-N4)-methyltransferase|nr:16S rRNA (cytosine(1402)-N(4))-methyltransferase RsmH [Bacteroidales bacterium]
MEYHIPVLLNKSVEGLNIKPNGIYVDVTFGGGGHSLEIFSRLKTGRLIAFDQDEDAKDNLIHDERFIFVNHNFRFVKNFLKYYKFNEVDGILADLGVSSHHFDIAKRGFSYRYDGELDMRMNKNSDFSAKDLLYNYDEEDLARVFFEYGELRNSRKLARKIVISRKEQPITRIFQFLELLRQFTPQYLENKFFSKVFQALRIEVNHEMDALKEMLIHAEEMLCPGGRLVVITYHSLEDRLVKNFMKKGKFSGEVETDFYGNKLVPFKLINKKVILPEPDEIKNNRRARSPKLRIAEKL